MLEEIPIKHLCLLFQVSVNITEKNLNENSDDD